MDKELIMKLGEQDQDPFRHLYFEKDIENGGKGIFFHPKGFKWDREKSNENIDKYGFSFYLALNICKGYTVLFIDHLTKLSSGWVAYRKNGYLFERRDAGVVDIFVDYENDDYLDCTYIERAVEITDSFCIKYVDPEIGEWTSLYGLYNWGENKARLREIRKETGHKFAGWCYRDYPGSILPRVGLFYMDKSYSWVSRLGGFDLEKLPSEYTDYFFHREDLESYLEYYYKDLFGKVPMGQAYIKTGVLYISVGTDCPDKIVPLIVKELGLDAYADILQVEKSAFWRVYG